jgi:hypothetical protein
MNTPLRYRLALRAYPRSYRAQRRAEIEGTLAEASEESGGPSVREAWGLARAGFSVRVGIGAVHDSAGQLLLLFALIMLVAAFSPGRFWSMEEIDGWPIVTGPAPWMRILLVASGGLAVIVSTGILRRRLWPAWVGGLLVGGLAALLLLAGATEVASLLNPAVGFRGDPAGAGRIAAVSATVLTVLALAGLNRMSPRRRLLVTAVLMAATALVAIVPIVGKGAEVAAVAVAVAGFAALLAGGLSLRRELPQRGS